MSLQKPLRLWPGVAGVALIASGLIAAFAVPGATLVGLATAVGTGVAVLIWWLGFSRAPWADRLAAPVLMVGAVLAIRPLLHASIAGAGQDRLFYVLSLPVASFSLGLWAIATRKLSN